MSKRQDVVCGKAGVEAIPCVFLIMDGIRLRGDKSIKLKKRNENKTTARGDKAN